MSEASTSRERERAGGTLRCRRWWILTALLLLVVVLHAPLLRAIGAMLIVDDSQAGGTLIPLRNDPETLAATADLYARGGFTSVRVLPNSPRLTDRLGITFGSFAEARGELTARGVPEERIDVVPQVADGRRARLRAACMMARPDDGRRYALVAPRLESRAASSRVAAELNAADATRVAIVSRPSAAFDERRWWTSRPAVQQVFRGYLAWIDAAWNDDPEVVGAGVDWQAFEAALERGEKP